MKVYAIFIIISFMYLCIMFLLHFLLYSLILSVVGYLFSKIINIKLPYKSIFKIAVYSLTLPFVLYMIYMLITVFTNFNIKYFDIAYNAISYIYIITAILTIKSDLTKQQMEVGKIIQVQKKVREEEQKKEPKKEKKEEDKKEHKEKDKKKNKGQEEGTPEGTKA